MKKITTFLSSILNHSVTKGSLIVLTGSMIANFLAYLYHLVVGRVLGPDKYGELAALLSLMYLLNVPASGLQTILTKYFSSLRARQKSGEVKSLFSSAFKITVTVEILGFICLLLLLNPLSDFLHISSKINFIWLYLIFSTYLISVIQISAYQAYQMFLESNIVANVGALLRLVTGAAGAAAGVGATLIANIMSNAVMFILSLYPIRFIINTKPRPLSISKRNMLYYGMPTLATMLGLTAIYSQDVILVKHFFMAREAGIYSSLSVLGKVIFYASSALGFVLFPIVSERKELKSGHRQIVMSALGTIAGISLAITLFYFLFPRLVVDLLFGRAFYDAAPYLGYFGLFITFFSLVSLLINVCLAAEKTWVWLIAVIGALSQTIFISLYHRTLIDVIWVNLSVSIVLFIVLLLYYGYEKEPS